jgi:hypothetical protein
MMKAVSSPLRVRTALPFALCLFPLFGCDGCTRGGTGGGDSGPRDDGSVLDASITADATPPPPRDSGPIPDGSFLDPDAACSQALLEATVERLPVDIVWVVDNSASMAPAIDQVTAGLNEFATVIESSGIDYRVIMLALRGRGATTVSGSTRYAVCIPPPLSGDTTCGDGPRFFQVEADIRSTQPVEQILGTLAQTTGYLETDDVGSAPWRDLLRADATKTIVFVTDDNSRTCARPVGTCAASDPPLTSTSLEDFPGGPNPFNSRTLGPGLLTSTYGDLFAGYTVSAVYGWGSETDDDVRCSYSDGSMPPSAGQTYSELVRRTGGVRARICDGAGAWAPFFDAVATAVTRTSRIACDVAIPPPGDGLVLDPNRVNVIVRTSDGPVYLPRRAGASACDERGGWYYDDPDMPTRVFLCPASCEYAQGELGPEGTGLDVQLGCDSILI